MESDLVADYLRSNDSSLDSLDHAEPTETQERMEKVMEFEHCHGHGEHDSEECSQVGNNKEDSGSGSDDDGKIDADNPETDAVQHGKDGADRELAADETGQDFVDFRGPCGESAPVSNRHEICEAVAYLRQVFQKIVEVQGGYDVTENRQNK